MLAQERHALILDMLREKKIIRISDIATQFGISNLTARRDLDALQAQQLIRRVHGGAVLLEQENGRGPGQAPVRPRGRNAQREEIRAIGKLAASLIRDGDVVFLGTGTTVLEVARHMRRLSNLTVLTNSLAVINELADSGNTIYVLGGILDGNEYSMSGPFAVEMVRTFCADWAFIGCGGASIAHGITDYGEPGLSIYRVMVQNAARSVLVAGSRKFESDALSIVCPINAVSMVITDEGVPSQVRQELTQLGVELKTVRVSGGAPEDDA